MKKIKKQTEELVKIIKGLDLDSSVEAANYIKESLHKISPFKSEPVDCVLWVKNDQVIANEYNPNKVAPPEMELLEISIDNDGYTQPIVTFPNKEKNEIVDGFHRSRVGKESKKILKRVHGYLPVVQIRSDKEGKNERVASTIRHNRARGKHQVDAMSEIVLELKNRNWKNERIARELGMDEDEILRLCQITGLQSLFTDKDFSKAWESSDSIKEYEPITDEISEEESERHRTTNTSDPQRIFHTHDKWECAKAGFYASVKAGMSAEECEKAYASFLSDSKKFRKALKGVTSEWKNSCEHYLTNKAMNRIAWLGQASMCYATGIPSKFCSGFNLLSQRQQEEANEVALEALNNWLKKYNMEELTMSEAISEGRQVDIY